MSHTHHKPTAHNPFAAGRPPINPEDRKVVPGRIRFRYLEQLEKAVKAGGFKDNRHYLESVIHYIVKHNLLQDVRKNSVDN